MLKAYKAEYVTATTDDLYQMITKLKCSYVNLVGIVIISSISEPQYCFIFSNDTGVITSMNGCHKSCEIKPSIGPGPQLPISPTQAGITKCYV